MTARLSDRQLLALAAHAPETAGEWTIGDHLHAPDLSRVLVDSVLDPAPEPAAVPTRADDASVMWATANDAIVVTAVFGRGRAVQAAYGGFATIWVRTDEEALLKGAELFVRLCAEMGS